MDEVRHAASSSGDGLALAQAQAQLIGLGRLHHRLAHAQGASLVSIRAEIAASVAVTQSFLQQARAVATIAQAADVALEAASGAARRDVNVFVHDFYERRVFEKDLHFTSPEDEEAYRRREAEHQRAINEAQAEHTPEGDLRAIQLAKEQLKDAGAHGATASEEYQKDWNALNRSGNDLAAQLAAKTQTRADQVAPDPLDDVKASFRTTGVVVADQNQQGHGVSATGAALYIGRA
jgi:hypothetical protein